MADTYVLNGSTAHDISVVVNGGQTYTLAKLDLQQPNPDQTVKMGLGTSAAPDQIGLGRNEVRVTIGSATVLYTVDLTAAVIISLDVQLVVFEDSLMAKNTISTDGFEISAVPRAKTGEAETAAAATRSQRPPPAIVSEEDADITFSRLATDAQSGAAVYAASNNGPGGDGVALTYFYRFPAATAPEEALTLAQSFEAVGAYVFADEALDGTVLLSELGTALRAEATVFSRLAWRLAAESYDVVQGTSASAVAEDHSFAIGAWQVFAQRNTRISLDETLGALRLTKAQNEDSLQVRVDTPDSPRAEGTRPEQILLPLIGRHRGSLTFAWDWSHYSLETGVSGSAGFGGNLRVFFGDTPQTAQMAQYPLFTPAADPGRFNTPNLFFNTYVQPMAPLDDRRTRLSLDLSQPNALSSTYIASTTNASVTLTPAATPKRQDLTAGFGFARNATNQDSTCYMCPVGEFEVAGLTRDQSISAASSANNRIQIRGGLGGSEYLLVKPGDHLSFESGRPAFAKGYTPGSSPVPLDDALTTAWVRPIRQNQGEALVEELIDTSYCAQPASSTYFGKDLGATPLYNFPIAVGASLVQFDGALPDIAPEEEEVFPLMPYGGVYYADEEQGIENPNPDLSSQALEAMERQVIARDRRARLAPYFDQKFGPIFFDTSTNAAFDGGYARTPLGLLAGLNPTRDGVPPSGSIQNIILARSPQADAPTTAQQIALGPNGDGVVNPVFSNSVLDENLFLVATDPAALAPFESSIKLGDFTFQLGVGNASDQAVAIFKFQPGISLEALIKDTDAWTALTGTATSDAVQQRLLAYIADAKSGGALFDPFLALLKDPNWNGVLFFNTQLDYQALPLDIQILLGGIKGRLTAHHFGITINRVDDKTADADIERSSLFAVINYDEAFVPPTAYPDFQVLLLNVRFVNSKLEVFDSKIAFSIDTLFGSKVQLAVAPETDHKDSGTIVINGVYTLFEDGTGSLVFSTQDARSFVFDSSPGALITAQSIGDATLVPITRNPGTGDCVTLATSALRIAGLTAFRNVASTGPDGKDTTGDIFSYGEVKDDMPTKGLSINGYSFAMQTCIKADNTANLQGGIVTDLLPLKVDQQQSIARLGSLEQTLPCQIEALDLDRSGLTPTASSEWQVRIEGEKYEGAPVYSLRFSIPLGMFGALSAFKSDLTATLYVGWDPTQTDPTKAIGVIMRLPPEISGPKGFNFEGIISSSFEYIQIDRLNLSDTDIVSVLRLVHYQGSLLKLFFNYVAGPKDLGIFGYPGEPSSTNSLFFVGKSTDTDWPGPTIDRVLDGVPIVFLLRAYEVKTDPTNPNVIKEVFDKLSPFKDMTVADFVSIINANSYNSDAGIAFGIKFEYQSLALTAVLHDNTFYGAQIKLTPEKKKDDDDKDDETKPKQAVIDTPLRTLLQQAAVQTQRQRIVLLADDDEPPKDDDGFLSKVKDFTFTIIYRKVSDEVGVFSADIYLNLGQINMGAVQFSLPNFGISIWTNGDWRFAIGWPFTGATAHPITGQFQAGPVPVIVKAGFYLGKLSSAAAPEQFGTEFGLIWTFGLGLAGGVGKEFEQGPLKAGASLMLGATFEGFLASFDGTFTSNGVDYWWWGISLSLTGNVFGKVDFKVIAVEVSLTVSITVAFAIETKHKTPLKITAEVKAKASIKIVFVKISFSFSAKLDILTTEFGSGTATAKLDGPTPTAVQLERFDVPAMRTRTAMMHSGAHPASLRAPDAVFAATADAPVALSVLFALQPTSVSADGTTWAPQGVATLVMETGDASSDFGLLCDGLAQWLLTNLGTGDNFHDQLLSTAKALQEDRFQPLVAQALAAQFVFNIHGGAPGGDTAYVTFPMPESLALSYNGTQQADFGTPPLPSDYVAKIAAYFNEAFAEPLSVEKDDVQTSFAGMLFDEFFVMLSQQMVQQMIETGAPDLNTALAELSLADLGGFVSRFLMGGLRLPDPADPDVLRAAYVLSHQQFPLQQVDETWVLSAQLLKTADTPAWITVADGTSSSLAPEMVHTSGPASLPWQAAQLQPLTEGPQVFAMNNILNWVDGAGNTSIINALPETVLESVRRGDNTPLYLSQQVLGGATDGDQQVDLSVPGVPWPSDTALAMPVRLAAIPDPSGDPGAILPGVFSLLGTDEAHRALLKNLLDDEAAGVTSVDLLASAERGNWTSTAVPSVLVRTDLSTTSTPGVAVFEAIRAVNTGPNYAKLPEGGDQLRAFLRLLWEVSVVNSSGFYLQVDGLDSDMFIEGPADLMIVVRFGTAGPIVAAKPYQNVLVGAKPEAGKAVFSTLVSDAQGTPVPGYAASYAGGAVGWSVLWEDAPAEADAAGGGFLQDLYQLLSFKVTQINGAAFAQNWSRPVTANDTSAEAEANTVWSYEKAFQTAPLVGAENRYAAVGDTLGIKLSVEDVFGNTLPETLVPSVDLAVVFNDDLLGLGNWTGTQASYLVSDQDGLNIWLNLTFDPDIILSPEGKVDPELRKTVAGLYAQAADQLGEAGAKGRTVKAGLETGGILADGALETVTDGGSLTAALENYLKMILSWVQADVPPAPPQPMMIPLALDKAQPAKWPGDLQELRVDLVLNRAGVPDEIALKSPATRRLSSPVQPVEEKSDDAADPSGLTTFSNLFERAYYPFDGAAGTVKVATGTNSDVSSLRFGQRSIWLQRWGKGTGTEVDVQTGADNQPVFYAPPPLSTQLITREVQGLRVYNAPDDFTTIDSVFSSIDMDLWAQQFLRTVETIFSPTMAPNVAENSSATVEVYDPFVTNKQSLAGSLADKLEYVYVEEGSPGSPATAKQTWQQALLRTLENDYGFSTLTQIKALVTLNGPIEAGGDPDYPPQLYGSVRVPGDPETDALPYALTPAALPLVEGENWLNFLASAQDPGAQRAFTLDLNYEVNQVEHLRDGGASDRGYVPSSWLTFVLQQNPDGLPQGQDNTLTQQIGETRIPIPLRTYPPLPQVQAARAEQKAQIGTIADALTWDAVIQVQRAPAAQDTLNLTLAFNAPDAPVVAETDAVVRGSDGREAPKDLFAALARFITEYPQLAPDIAKLGPDGPPQSVQAVQAFSQIIADAAVLWPAWKPPQPAQGDLAKVRDLVQGNGAAPLTREVWNFAIQDVEGSDTGDLEMVKSGTSRTALPPWPVVEGYELISQEADKAVYRPTRGTPLHVLKVLWKDLFVLDYQKMTPSAYTLRNKNLALPPEETNPNFVYRTETVTWPTPVVPLITVPELIALTPPAAKLQTSVQALLSQLMTAPAQSHTNGAAPDLAFETAIHYRYEVIANADSSAFADLPVFLVAEDITPDQQEGTAQNIAKNLKDWRDTTGATSPKSSLRFQWTVFANDTVAAGERLPLVQFQGLVIAVVNEEDWW